MTNETTIDQDAAELDQLLESMEQLPAQLTTTDMDNLERRWRESMRARRMALVMLTQSFQEFQQNVETDREFAVAVAATFACVEDQIEFCRGVAKTLETSKIWMMMALVGREDMEEVLEAGKAAVDEEAAA